MSMPLYMYLFTHHFLAQSISAKLPKLKTQHHVMLNSTKYFPPSSIYNILQGQSMGKRYIITFQKVTKSYSGNKNGGQFSIMYSSLIKRFYNKISKHHQKIDMGFDRTMFRQYSTHKIKPQIPQMKFKTVDLIIFFSAIQFSIL